MKVKINKPNKGEYLISFAYFSLMITIIMLVWNSLSNVIQEMSWFFQSLFSIMSGLGGVMISIILITKLEETRRKNGNTRNS
jgi:uncharacterized membrane protein